MDGMSQKLEQVQAEVNKVIKGKEDVVKKVLAAVIAGGHILMEDIPGVGKTTLATTFAKTLDLRYHRVQFTPDVLPSDLVGFSVYQKETGKFVYHAGAVMCNLFLGDEINRTSSRTQSALLEAHAGRVGPAHLRHGDGGRRHPPGARTLYRNCNPEPHRRRRHADAAAVSAGPFHGLRRNGLPR